jgi:hypothetical protein
VGLLEDPSKLAGIEAARSGQPFRPLNGASPWESASSSHGSLRRHEWSIPAGLPLELVLADRWLVEKIGAVT